jgi:acetyltransferase-like isoleucine patch superfamily enzyme
MRRHIEIDEGRFDEPGNRRRIAALRKAGVMVWGANRVFVGPEVALDNIEPQSILMNAILRGESTAVGAESRIGTSGTASLINVQVGRRVELGAGTYRNAAIFHDAKVRGFAELRQGTVLEESAETAHNVGLKHTFFSMGVVAGSLINYCDVLVTGGSSRQDHTEIGSEAVHFNFDARGDKFGSLFGDARGLLLRQRRIFIGGNTGIVGPVQVGFGAVIAAGETVREDIAENCLYTGSRQRRPAREQTYFDPNVYHDLERKFVATAALCGNLRAIETWYRTVRLPFSRGLDSLLCRGAISNVRLHIEHRGLELDKLIVKLSRTMVSSEDKGNPFRRQHQSIVGTREAIRTLLTQTAAPEAPAGFQRHYRVARKTMGHCAAIREIPESIAGEAEEWLSRIASNPVEQMRKIFKGRK